MKRTLALVALLAVAVVLYFVLRGEERGPEAVRGADIAADEAVEASESTLAATDAASERTSVDEAAAAAPVDAPPAELAAAPAVDESQLARIRGVLVHHDGRPAGDATLVVHGWTANSEREKRYGLPAKKWEDVVASPNADGSFEVVFEAPRAFQFTLDVHAPWAITLDWRWSELAPGSVTDLGTVTMPLGGRIEGRVALPDGSPAPGKWGVIMRDVFRSPLRSFEESVSFAKVDAANQTFAFAGVAPGSVEVELSSAVLPDRTQRVDVVAGQTSTVVFVHDGPPADRRISVQFIDRCSYVFGVPDLARVHMRAIESGALVPGTTTEKIDRRLIFGVEPGRHVLVVADPRFQPFESEPIESGSHFTPKMRGSVALTLVVTQGGVPVTDAKFEFERPEGRDRMLPPELHRITPLSTDVPGEYVFATVPDPQVWSIAARGSSPHTLDLSSGFEPGSTQRIEVRLEAARTISGVVVRSSGAPVAGAEVVAHPVVEAVPPTDPTAYVQWQNSVQQRPRMSAFTDDQGRFELGPLTDDLYDVRTVHDLRVCAFALDVSAATHDLVLRLEPTGRIEGRVSPVFRGCDGMRVNIGWNLGRERLPSRIAPFGIHMPMIAVDAEGRFTIEDVPAGRPVLTVNMPGATTHSLFGSSTSMGRALEPITVDVAPDTTAHVVVDVATELPLEAHVRVNDLRGSGLALQVVGKRVGAQVNLFGADAAGSVGADGLAIVAPLEPGTWSFAVEPQAGTWSQPIPGEHVVEAGTTLELSFDIELVRGSVTVVDATGVPVGRVFVRHLRKNGWSTVSTDDRGVLELVLPPGTHHFASHSQSDGTSEFSDSPTQVELVWTSDGPADPLLLLPARE
jgi:hypothetical protein